jgi:O-antigen ligase
VTLDPRTLGGGAVREAREAARRQARALSGGLVALLATGFGVLFVVVLALLDYVFDQDPHRLVKILLGVAVIGAILSRPRFGLMLLPVATPFLSWLPVIPAPGLNTLNLLMVGLFLPFALQRVLRRETLFRGGALAAPIGALLLLAGLSVLRGIALPTGYAYDGERGGMNLFRTAMTFSVYFVTLAMATGRGDRRRLTWAVVIGFALECWATIAGGRTGGGMRAEGSFGQSNELGAYLAMFTAFALALVPALERRWLRALLFAAVVAGVVATLMTVSRGALLAIAVAMVYVALRSSRLLAALLVVAVVSSPAWMPEYMVQRLSGTEIAVEGTDEEVLEGSAQARIDTWKAMTKVIAEHPFDGIGFTGLKDVLPDTGEALGLEVKDSSHNTFLRVLAELGILGLLVFVWLLGRAWRLGWTASLRGGDRFDRAVGVGIGGATIALAVSCAFGDRFFSIMTIGNFLVACALLDDALRERREGAA